MKLSLFHIPSVSLAKISALTQADLCDACFIACHLVVEVTGFSQTVNAEKTLPHSASQAWRNAHSHESLNLKTQRECVGKTIRVWTITEK